MGEATIGLWLVMLTLLAFPMTLLRVNAINYSSGFFSNIAPLSLLSVIFSYIAVFLYFFCVILSNKVKNSRQPSQELINQRDCVYIGSIVSVVLSIFTLLLSFKFD
jgi:hypothetical protein